MEEALSAWTGTLESVFPTRVSQDKETLDTGLYETKNIYVCKNKVAKPTVFIPVFPARTVSMTAPEPLRRQALRSLQKYLRISARKISGIRLMCLKKLSARLRLSCSQVDFQPEMSRKVPRNSSLLFSEMKA